MSPIHHPNGWRAQPLTCPKEACTVVRAVRLAKCSTCAQTLRASSFATRTKPPGTSAMSCEHTSGSDWCQCGVPHSTRNGWGPGKGSVRAGGNVAGSACSITSSVAESNGIVEEAGPNELASALCKLPPRDPMGAGSHGTTSLPEAREVKEPTVSLTKVHVVSTHLRQVNEQNTMRVSARVRPRARQPRPDWGQGSTLAWDHALTQRRGSLDRRAERCGARSMFPDHHAHLQLKERLSSYEAFCCPLGRPALASQEELTK